MSVKLVYQYVVIFFNFETTSNHLHPLQLENCGSNSRLVVDKDDYGKFWKGFKHVKALYLKKITQLKLSLADAIHNVKWMKITHIFLIRDQAFANLDVLTPISFPISVIWPASKTDWKRL